MLRFGAAARDTRRTHREGAGETTLLSAALQEAVAKLKAQERAMAARAEASERLSGEIIASLTAGLLVVGLNGEVRILNPAGRRMLRRRRVGACSRTTGGCSREPPLSQVIDECLATRHADRRGARCSCPTRGTARRTSASPCRRCSTTTATLHGAICLFTDLTAVKELEEQLRLKDSLATVGELTAGIAHEFRNGLATIHGYSKLLDLNALPDAYRPYVEGIRAETESLGQVVTNFLNFARPAQLTLTRVDLRAICERAAEEIRADAADARRRRHRARRVRRRRGRRGAAAAGVQQPAPQRRRGLRRRLARAGRRRSESEIDRGAAACRASPSTTTARASTPAPRERVFRPFFTSKRNGTGLGLALVQKIIVFHNGRIAVGTSPLGGASLQVTLPLDA